MNEYELISKQALLIEEIKEENENLKNIINAIHLEIINVAGPLNGNYYQYNKEQLKIFFKIEEFIKNA